MPRKEVPTNYYYFVKVTYKNGAVHPYRFKNKSHRRSAIAAFEKDNNVKKVEKSEGYINDKKR